MRVIETAHPEQCRPRRNEVVVVRSLVIYLIDTQAS
jgi:hypothetical protein